MKNMTNSFTQRKKPSSSWEKPIESGLHFYILTAVKFFRPTLKDPPFIKKNYMLKII